MRQRKLIAAVVTSALLLVGMAGCARNTPPPVDDTVSGDLEVFSWWEADSEALGLEQLVGVLKQQYPDVTFVKVTSPDMLQTRLAGGQPPDSFQIRAGADALDYIKSGQLQDITDLYTEFGLTTAFPKDLVNTLTYNTKIYTIPTNVHRANLLWASVPRLKKAGLSTKDVYYEDIDSFIGALAKSKASGVKEPLAIGNTWCQVHLLETVLIADLGPDLYKGLFDDTTSWAGDEVAKAIEHFGTLMSYTNSDREDINWDQALDKVLEGEAVFTIMGDWVPDALESRGKVVEDDYLWAPAPGTSGVFDFLADAYGLATGSPNPKAAKAWLEVLSSKAGQEAFNKANGSIPARTDIDPGSFSEHQKATAEALGRDVIVPSLQHGAAATFTQTDATADVVARFTASDMKAADRATLQAELVAIFA